MLLAALIGLQPAVLLAGDGQPEVQPADPLSCSAPFELQWLRDLDFGHVAVARNAASQVDVAPDGGYRQLGGAFVSSPPGAAEFSFCGPPGSRFELRVDNGNQVGLPLVSARSARVAAGSIRVSAVGAQLQRLNGSLWQGSVGSSGRVTLRVGGRLDIPAGSGSSRPSVRISLALRVM